MHEAISLMSSLGIEASFPLLHCRVTGVRQLCHLKDPHLIPPRGHPLDGGSSLISRANVSVTVELGFPLSPGVAIHGAPPPEPPLGFDLAAVIIRDRVSSGRLLPG